MSLGKGVKWGLPILLGVIAVNVIGIFAYLQFADFEKQKYVPATIDNTDEFKQDLALQQMNFFKTGLNKFYADINRFPSNKEGLNALIFQPPALSTWNGPYLPNQEIPLDPWGNPYGYRLFDEKRFEVICFGVDGKEGGGKKNKDLIVGP